MSDLKQHKADGTMLSSRGERLRQLLAPLAQRRRIARGESIFDQDDNVSHIWFVLRGEARAVIYSEEGAEIWVQTFAPGDLFGHTCVMTEMPAQFGLVANTVLDVLILPAKVFERHLSQDPGFSRDLAEDLAQRLNVMTLRMFELATLSAPARIGMELLRLAQPIGIDADRMIIRPVPVLSNMALKVQSTRETVSRTVSRLQKLGLIARQPGAIVIEDHEAMREKLRGL